MNKIGNDRGLICVLLVLLVVLVEPLFSGVIIASILVIAVRVWFLVNKPSQLELLVQNKAKNLSALLFILLIVFTGRGTLNIMVNLLFSGTILVWFTQPRNEQTKNSQILFLSLVVLICIAALFESSLQFGLLYLILLMVLFAYLYLRNNRKMPFLASFRYAFKHLIYALPLAVFLFFTLPNLTPFWQLPKQQMAKSGLSEQMTPGEIANLARSSRLAFRAGFVNRQPASSSQLYWRTFAMEDYDGKSWSKVKISEQLSTQGAIRHDEQSEALSYNIIVEANNQQWLYALANSVSTTPGVSVSRDNSLVYRLPIRQKFNYQVNSLLTAKLQKLPDAELKLNLNLPSRLHPKTYDLTELLWQKALSIAAMDEETMSKDSLSKNGDSQNLLKGDNRQANNDITNLAISHYSDLILTYFQANDFRYSLTPGTLNGDHLDDFLFTKKVGFCAHFASAYTVMLRMQGIPARVVVGYQGGETNDNGEFISVYDSDAHAWAEYFQQSENGVGHWIRVDPTFVVSPQRITDGSSGLLASQLGFLDNPILYFRAMDWLVTTRHFIESLDYYWSSWVLNYDANDRRQLLEKLMAGQNQWLGMVLVLTSLLLTPVVMIYLLDKYRSYQRLSWQQKYLLKLQQRLNKLLSKENQTVELHRQHHWSLRQYQSFVSRQLPEKSSQLQSIFDVLETEFYGPKQCESNRELRAKLNQLLVKL